MTTRPFESLRGGCWMDLCDIYTLPLALAPSSTGSRTVGFRTVLSGRRTR